MAQPKTIENPVEYAREVVGRDPMATHLSIEVEEVRSGYARCSVTIRPEYLNAVERALTDHLREVLVFDHSSSVIDVPRFLAAKWARSDDELFQLARENLEHRSTPLVEEGGWLVAHERDTFLFDAHIERVQIRLAKVMRPP